MPSVPLRRRTRGDVCAHLGRDRRLDVGQIEHAGLRGELRMEHDLQEQVAEPSARAGSRRRRARHRPRTSPPAGACGARRGSARGPTDIRRGGAGAPRSRASPTARRGRARPRPAPRTAVPRGSRASARRSWSYRTCRSGPPGGRRVEPAEHGERVTAGRSVPAGQRLDGDAVVRRAEYRQRHEEEWARCLNGRRDDPLRRDDLDRRQGRAPSATVPPSDQGVELCPRLPSPRSIAIASFLSAYQSLNAFWRRSSSWRPSGSAPALRPPCRGTARRRSR